jgi:hypothetical protein
MLWQLRIGQGLWINKLGIRKAFKELKAILKILDSSINSSRGVPIHKSISTVSLPYLRMLITLLDKKTPEMRKQYCFTAKPGYREQKKLMKE